MTYKFAKALLMGSVMTMGAFGLVACGDDSSSGPSNKEDKPINVPTTQDQIIQFNNLTANDLGGAGIGPIKLTGSVTVNATDTVSSATPENIKITDISFQIGKVTADGSLKTTPAQATIANVPNYALGIDNVTFTEANVQVDLASEALTECGEYKLIITAKASDGAKDFENTQTVSFVRSDMYCATAPESSSGVSTDPTSGVAMVACPEITLSTDLMPGLDLATCTASASTTADIVVTKGNGSFNITSGNGTLFAPISNGDDYFVGAWPEDEKGSVFTSDFKYKVITGTSIDNFAENDDGSIYVAKTAAFNEATGAGFFAFGVTKATEGNNGDYTIKMKVYKAQ